MSNIPPRRRVTFGFDENGSFLTTRYTYPYEYETSHPINIVNNTGNTDDNSHTFMYRVRFIRNTLKDLQKKTPTSLPLKVFMKEINKLAKITDEELEDEEALDDLHKQMLSHGIDVDAPIKASVQDDTKILCKRIKKIKIDKVLSSSV
jgi:hypothetical protein